MSHHRCLFMGVRLSRVGAARYHRFQNHARECYHRTVTEEAETCYMKTLMVGVLAAAISALLIGACGVTEASSEPIPAPDFQKILSRLQDWDLKPTEIGEVRMPCYSVNPRSLSEDSFLETKTAT